MGLIQDKLASSPITKLSAYQKISLVIEELTGSEKRRVTLQGSAMPLDKIAGGIEQSVSSRDYFGSSRRALHIKGHHPLPTQFGGRWMYPIMNESEFVYCDRTNGEIRVSNPTQARELLSTMARAGQTVQVYWTTPNQNLGDISIHKSVSYQGILTKIEWGEENWAAITWTLHFEWEKESLTTSPLPILPTSVKAGNILTLLNNTTKQIKALATGVLSDVNSLIDGSLGYLTFCTNTASDLVEITEGFANLPATTAQKVMDGLISIKDASDDMAFASNNTAAAYTGVADAWNELTTDTTAWDYLYNDKDEAPPGDQVQSAVAAAQVYKAMSNVQYETSRQMRKAQQATKARVRDIFIEAKQGDSYRKWAAMYFKDVGLWLQIAMANGEFRDVIEVGRMYRIPLSEITQ